MNLDNPSKYLEELDPGLVADSIESLPDQIDQTLRDAGSVSIPEEYQKVKRVVLNGMGASNLGGRIVQSLFSQKLQAPVIIEPGYTVPGYVDEETLFILSSYSGNTEEPLSVYEEVKARGAKMAGITASHDNNKLERSMKEDNIPGFVFSPEHNPSDQPRLGLGYSIFSILFLLQKTGLVELNQEEITQAIDYLKENNTHWNPQNKTAFNKAKEIAQGLSGKFPVLVGAEFLEGNLHAFRNQICENSKNVAAYYTLPDLNHFLLESLSHPESNKDNLAFLFLDSPDYSSTVQKRSELTQKVVEKQGIKSLNYQTESSSFLGQSLEILQLGAWISFYLAIANDENPSLIPWVDWFKQELKK